jgi:hypothetical protein
MGPRRSAFAPPAGRKDKVSLSLRILNSQAIKDPASIRTNQPPEINAK